MTTFEFLHDHLGVLTIGIFLVTLVTRNLFIAIIGFISLSLCGFFGSKVKLKSEEAKSILRKYCIPLTMVSTFCWIAYIFLLLENPSQALNMAVGMIGIVALGVVQFWSGPKVTKAEKATSKY